MPVGRTTQLPYIHELSAALSPAFPLVIGAAQTNVILGTVPAGAVLIGVHLLVSQAFNSTTNLVFLGLGPGLGQLLSNGDLKTLARTDTVVAAASAGPFAAEQQIWMAVVNTGATPTVGAATIWLEYLAGAG